MIVQHTNFGNQKIVRCGFHEPTHNYGDHLHEYSEVVYVLDGEIESTVNGVTEIAKAGDFIIITPFQVHSTHTPDKCKIFICVISNDLILSNLAKSELFVGYRRSVFTPPPYLASYLNEKFIKAATDYKAWHLEKDFRSLKASVCALFNEYTSVTEPAEKTSHENILADVILYLNEHFRENITLKTVSKALGYAPGYISHCLETLPSMNFSTILNSLRVEYAKLLLTSGNYANVDVAYESGFSCERSFYRAFLKKTGTTPQKYVKKEKSN